MKNSFGLIGYPLDHSWSPSYFQQQFKSRELHLFSYDLFPLRIIDDLLPLLKEKPDLHGINVTIPYKEAILPYLNDINATAKEIGAVNTVLIRRSPEQIKLTGYNTDAEGFSRSADFSGHRSALVLGTGGASRAVVYALNALGIPCTRVSRSGDQGNVLTYHELDEQIISGHTLIINTTPVGMFPNEEIAPPFPFDMVSSRHFLYDLIYNPEITAFMKQGIKRGARVQSGIKMLHLQADIALKLFLNIG